MAKVSSSDEAGLEPTIH